MSLAELRSSVVEDPSLAGEGERVLAWTRADMPLLTRLRGELADQRPSAGRHTEMCLTTLSTVETEA